MKLIWFVVAAVSIIFGNVKAHCNIGYLDQDTISDAFHGPSPTKRSGKCLYDCMLREADMLGENGLINADRFVEFISTLKYLPSTLTTLKQATNNCKGHRHLTEDKCETAALFVQCSSEEVGKNGLDPKIMGKVIREAHDIFSPKDTKPPRPPIESNGYFLFDWPSIDWWPH